MFKSALILIAVIIQGTLTVPQAAIMPPNQVLLADLKEQRQKGKKGAWTP
jgi:hypothetical protein